MPTTACNTHCPMLLPGQALAQKRILSAAIILHRRNAYCHQGRHSGYLGLLTQSSQSPLTSLAPGTLLANGNKGSG